MRICVMTAGHLSTSPRMLKAADALARVGHDVRVVSTRHEPWADAADVDVRRTRTWPWTVVDYRAGSRLRVVSGVRHRGARGLAAAAGAARVPYGIATCAFSRVHEELVAAALATRAEFYYGGTTGALAAAAAAGRAAGMPFGVDLEDFYRGQHAGPSGPLTNALAARVEDRVLPAARCVTASTTPIADEYERACGVRPVAIHNTFPLPPRAPDIARRRSGPLRLYWFSQTIGPDRGLDEVMTALGLADIPARVTLRGRPVPGFTDAFIARARQVAPRAELELLTPAPPDSMVPLCEAYDVGLGAEQPTTRNRELCLSNKLLTYVLAGLAVVLTDTTGQRVLANDLGPGALVYQPGRPEQLVAGLRRWSADPDALAAARRAAWSAAEGRWHWEHPAERDALVAAIERAVR